MAWLAIDKDGTEAIYERIPSRGEACWFPKWINDSIEVDEQYVPFDKETSCLFLPKGSIEKLIDKELTWEDEPVEL